MPKIKFNEIYKDLKSKIENEEYEYQQMLPSENTLVEIYHCSRNTIRRAVALLAEEGCVQPLHGKGVRVIYQPVDAASFLIGGIETFQESARRNHRSYITKVVQFDEILCDERLSRRTGFQPGDALYYVRRVRYLDGKPLILDTNFFLKSLVPGLTEAIAEKSIYEYIENDLQMAIVTSRRTMTVEACDPCRRILSGTGRLQLPGCRDRTDLQRRWPDVRVHPVPPPAGLLFLSDHGDPEESDRVAAGI